MAPTLALVTAVLTTTGCGTDGSSPPPADPGSPAASYVRTGPWGTGNSALLEGVLGVENGCVVVQDDRGALTVVVLPTDFVWDEDAMTFAGLGETLAVGDRVRLGGGFVPDEADVVHLPVGCDDLGELFLVHSV